MRIQSQLFLAACIAILEFVPVEPQTEIGNLFRNLFDSIAKNDLEKSGTYHNILKDEVLSERQAFYETKKELRMAQNRNFDKKRNLYRNNGNRVAIKREATELTSTSTSTSTSTISTTTRRIWRKTYSDDRSTLQRWFLNLHPDVNNIEWPEVNNLRQKTHRRICDQVHRSINPFFEKYVYVEERKDVNPEGLSTRVKGPALLDLDRTLPVIFVVECVYYRNDSSASPPTVIYLTHANSSRVFVVNEQKNSENLFQLQTGLHAVSFSDSDE